MIDAAREVKMNATVIKGFSCDEKVYWALKAWRVAQTAILAHADKVLQRQHSRLSPVEGCTYSTSGSRR